MKKVLTKLLVLFAFIFLAPNIFAVELTENLTLEEDLEDCIIVKGKSNITIDLNNHNITCTGADAIYVENGAKLTIKGDGVVQSVTKGKAAIFNNGIVTLNGGTYTADNEKTAYYSILNHGEMTINEGVTVSQTNYKTSSLFDNGYSSYSSTNERKGYVEGKGMSSPILTINGGLFDGGMNTIKNDDGAILEINDGHFINNIQVAVMNWNIATINGGVFEVPTGNDKTTVFVGSYGNNSVDKGILVINDGIFNGDYAIEFCNDPEATMGDISVAITGGLFNSQIGFVNPKDSKGNDRPLWADIGRGSITGGVFTDTSIVPDEGYSLISIDQDNNNDGVNDVLVTEVQLIPPIKVSLKVDETYDTELSKDIKKYGTWTTSDSEIATVKNGIITAHKKGKATIQVKFGNDTIKYTVTVSRLNVSKPIVSGKYTYTAEEQEVVLSNYDEALMSISNNTGTLVGEYTTIVSLKDTVKYEWDDETDTPLEINWEIKKAKVNVPVLTTKKYNYTGESIIPEVSGFDSSIMNESGDLTGIEVGTYSIVYTLKDTDNYEWNSENEEVSISWTITKGKLAKPTLNPATYNYTGEEIRPTLAGFDENLMQLSGIQVGQPAAKYTLKVSLKDTDNYTWEDGTTKDVELVWSIVFGVTKLKATSTYNSIKLSWTAVVGADGYQVYRCNSEGANCTKLTTTEALKYTDKKLTFNKKYYYKVRAYRLEDGEKIYGKYSTLISKKTALTATTVTASTDRYRNILVEWEKVSGASRYYIYRCNSKGEKCKEVGLAYDLDFVNTNSKEGVNYIYKVRPYRDGVYGPYSEGVTGFRLDDTITLSVKNTAYKTNTITIGNIETATKYYIYRATSKNGTYTKIKTLTASEGELKYIDKDISFNETYYYKVKITNGVNNSDYSEIISVTTNKVAKPTFEIETELSYATINIDKVSGATGYQIAYSTDGEDFETLVKTSDLSYDKKFDDGTYYIKVRAYRKVGSTYYYGKYSAVKELIISTEK